MPTTVYPQPFGLTMQAHCVAIQMVIGRDEVHVPVCLQEINHKVELAWKVKVIVFREIHELSILLGEQSF